MSNSRQFSATPATMNTITTSIDALEEPIKVNTNRNMEREQEYGTRIFS